MILAGGIALAERSRAEVLGDIVWERQGQAEGEAGAFDPAVFPHWIHRIRYRCSVCHPALFEMKRGADKITMDAMEKGKFCGACHTGRIAFKIGFETCNRCHLPQAE
jgi:c(7)-type cytochrome triheme protein